LTPLHPQGRRGGEKFFLENEFLGRANNFAKFGENRRWTVVHGWLISQRMTHLLL